ncbi:hypothetical protein BpHYR1_004655 [Brachionus plicatilis]|uniref:Uncharacterized protein n=1 Tax=Brachionus plicatilis TaxID=10195 RepID=A0A3M7S7I3_BRAPC|nr:hypothetical protein BpHYR1_004655 [Brachionus plicatilis]
MGCKKSKPSNAVETKPVVVPPKNELTEQDLDILAAQSGMSGREIRDKVFILVKTLVIFTNKKCIKE